jgi:hypothetical protein
VGAPHQEQGTTGPESSATTLRSPRFGDGVFLPTYNDRAFWVRL